MAEGWHMLDAGFPSISKDEPVTQQVEKLVDYLFQMKQGLQITLQKMDTCMRRIEQENKDLKKKIEEMEA